MVRAVDGISKITLKSRTRLQVYQFPHQTSRREVALQEHDQISLREEDTGQKYEDGRLRPDSLLESVETGSWKNESSDDWDE